MTQTSRLLASFSVASGADTIRVSANGYSDADVTVASGTYYWDALASALVTALNAAFAASVWEVSYCIHQAEGIIIHPGRRYVDPDRAEGRPRVNMRTSSGDGSFSILWTHASSTLDPYLLGSDGSSDEASSASALAVDSGTEHVVGDYVHRWGWYPQQPFSRGQLGPERKSRLDRSLSALGYPDTVDRGEYDVTPLLVQVVSPALMRIAGAAHAGLAAAHGLTQGDPYAAWERFCLDVQSDDDVRVRAYPDIEQGGSDDYHTPGIIRIPEPGDPLDTAPVRIRAGELRDLSIVLQEVG